MKTISVPLKQNSYKIVIGHKILSELGTCIHHLRLGDHAYIVTNPIIRRFYGTEIWSSLKKGGSKVDIFEVPDGEKSKSVKETFRLIEGIARQDMMAEPFVVALGGGVIGDLGGFVAAVYKRGIPYLQVPTTLLAQIDSAIGGKVGIDLPIGKNLVGSFYQPRLVYSDVACLASLDQRQLRNGLAEAIKYGVIASEGIFSYIESYGHKLLKGNPANLMELVIRCGQIKTDVVSQDEKETKGIRSILNFGHTVGHAIEAAGRYKIYQHGEAIALGMRVAADISNRMGMFSRKNAQRLNGLITAIGLPEKIQKISINEIFKTMRYDKKFRSGKNRFVLATKIGTVRIIQGIPHPIIREAILAYM